MDKTEMIKERIALFTEIKRELADNAKFTNMDETTVFQEVCKDDRMHFIRQERYLPLRPLGDEKGGPGTVGSGEAATEKQVNLMIKLKIPSGKYTKFEASKLIEEALAPKKRSE